MGSPSPDRQHQRKRPGRGVPLSQGPAGTKVNTSGWVPFACHGEAAREEGLAAFSKQETARRRPTPHTLVCHREVVGPSKMKPTHFFWGWHRLQRSPRVWTSPGQSDFPPVK